MGRRLAVKIIVMLTIIGIVAVGLSVNNVSTLNEIGNNNDQITINVERATLKGDIASGYRSASLNAYLMYIRWGQDGVQEAVQGFVESVQGLKEDLETLRAIEEEQNDEQIYDAYMEWDNAVTAFVTTCESIYNSAAQGDVAGAMTMFVQMNVDKANAEASEQAYSDLINENAKSVSQQSADKIEQQSHFNMLSVGIVIVMDVLCLIYSILRISKPIKRASKQLAEINTDIEQGRGDLTKRLKVTSKDETGRLTKDINNFLDTLQGTMKKMVDSSAKMNESVATVSESIIDVNEKSMSTSQVMEELAATMEEVAANVQDISSSTTVAANDSTDISTASAALTAYANEMLTRAGELRKFAVENKEDADQVLNALFAKLDKAVENCQSVEHINDLTSEILSIAKQTNILALNASIEAARAGEAGKSFAVVADEISELAESSRQAANNIQEINNIVITAVRELVDQTGEMSKYINEEILPDYDEFVAGSENYSNDSEHVTTVVNEFKRQSEELTNIMGNISNAVSDITTSVQESANAIQTAATNTSILAETTENISGEMKINKEIADALSKETEKFVEV